jgi:hypothetical protein
VQVLDIVQQEGAEVVPILRDARPWIKEAFVPDKRATQSAYLNRSLLLGEGKEAAAWRAKVRAVNALLDESVEREVGYEVLRV